jgi:hypothetical protein
MVEHHEVLIVIFALRPKLSGSNRTNPLTIRDSHISKGRDCTRLASYLQQKCIILPSVCVLGYRRTSNVVTGNPHAGLHPTRIP